MMALTRNQKKEMVVKLYNQRKTTREIAKQVRISLRDIGIITRLINDEPELEPPKSKRAKAIQIFIEGKDTLEVLTTLDIDYNEVRIFYGEYLALRNLTEFINFYRENQQFLPFLLKIIEKMKQNKLFEIDIDPLINCLIYFKNFDILKDQLQHEVNCLLLEKKCLEDEVQNGKIPRLG
jgi:hypothetical protein